MKKTLVLLLVLNACAAWAQQFWGVTYSGGNYGMGVLFKYEAEYNLYHVVKHFDTPEGARPMGGLLYASDGKLYGTTTEGGEHNLGVLFSLDPFTRTYTVEHHFSGVATPIAQLMQAPSGLIYGTTTVGGYAGGDGGSIFSFDPTSKTYTHLYEFNGANGEGPRAMLTAFNGRIYGSTWKGGQNASGTLFSFAEGDSELTIHHHFAGPSGYHPNTPLIDGGDGKLYGLVSSGGGNFYSFEPSTGTFTNLAILGNITVGGIAKGKDGLLYTIHMGGIYGQGLILSYNTNTKNLDLRYLFTASSTMNGFNHQGALLQASDGKLYGISAAGGSYGSGTIYAFDPASNTQMMRHHFQPNDGASPQFTSLIEANADAPTVGLAENVCGATRSKSQFIRFYGNAESYNVRFKENGNVVANILTSQTALRLSRVNELQKGKTYQVSIRANVAGKRSQYGPECDLHILNNAPIPATRLHERFTTAPVSLHTQLHAVAVPGTFKYNFNLADSAGNMIGTVSEANTFSIQSLAPGQWNSTYLVQAQAVIGIWEGPWGEWDTVRVVQDPNLRPLPMGDIGQQCGGAYSIYHTIKTPPTPGATAYVYEIYSNNTNTSPVGSVTTTLPSFTLNQVPGIHWGKQYNFRVKPIMGDTEGLFSNLGCYFSVVAYPDNSYLYALIPTQRNATLSLGDTLRSVRGIGVTKYEFGFFKQGELVAVTSSFTPRMPLMMVPGIAEGQTYQVKVRIHYGPFQTAWGPDSNISIQTPPVQRISVVLYPNPAHNALQVQLPKQEACTVQGYKDGILIFSQTFEEGIAPEINLSPYARGLYIIRVISKNGVAASSVMIE